MDIVMLEHGMISAVDRYVEAIKETETYKKYRRQLQLLKENREQYDMVNEYRQRNFEIQNTVGGDELFDRIEEFEKEYERLLEDPVVSDFLQAEVAFCRMIQDMAELATQKLDFE